MNDSKSTKLAHSGFSPLRIWALATSTVTQLMRMRIAWAMVALCALVVGLAFAFPSLSVEQQLKQLKGWSFGAMQLFFVLFAVAATSLLLPRDLEDRTLYTILCKPVPRYEYLIGKLLGMMLLTGAGMIIMDFMICGVVAVKSSLILSAQISYLEQEHQANPVTIARAAHDIAVFGLNSSIHVAVFSVFLKAAVVTALTLLISCFASTTLFTILSTAALIVGGLGEPLARDYFLHGHFTHVVEKSLSCLLAIICPDLGAFDLVDAVLQGQHISGMVMLGVGGLAALYILGYLAVAYLFFVEKEL